MKPGLLWRRLITQLYWRARLASIGPRSVIFSPLLISGARHMHLGDRTVLRNHARLEIVRSPGATWQPELRIGNHVNIEQGVHIICQSSVVIEDHVSITPYCVIVDTYHPFDPPDTLPSIGRRLPDRPTHVHIGEGSFIGAHTVILSDVRIGKGCVIGAGSVVSSDIPDYCVATGSPARVIKKFDPVSRQWQRVNSGSREQ